jgi:phosphoenolpyruvate---glycerone phosphotransferase subunit DhaL
VSVQALDAAGLAEALVHVCEAMEGALDVLTRADQAIGDGDHGLAIERGFRAAREALAKQEAPTDVGALLEACGTAMLSSMGGASGAIYGTLFRRGGRGLRGRPTFDAGALATFLEDGLGGVVERGGAKPGDKTLLDALAPAAEAAQGAAHGPLDAALALAAAAAEDGAERTRDMRATVGRARTLGERAVGHVDPGALSCSVMLRAWSEAVHAG